MVSHMRTRHSIAERIEAVILVILIALCVLTLLATIFLGPGLLPIVFVLGLGAFAIERLAQRSEGDSTIQTAIERGVPGEIAAWGKVARVEGTCQIGNVPAIGDTFVVAGGQIWPAMCAHAQDAVRNALERMEREPDLTDERVYYHDPSHMLDLELYRAPRARVERHRGDVGAPTREERAAGYRPSHLIWVARAIISGFMASIVMSVIFFSAFGIARLIAGIPVSSGLLGVVRQWCDALSTNRVLDLASSSLYLAGIIHVVVGVVWALVYAGVVERKLSGPSWRKGLEFSLLPWALSLLVFLPVVGGGVAGAALGAGPLPALGNLVLHLAYGITLGALYGPLGGLPADQFPHSWERDSRLASDRLERAMARGIVIGACVGLIISAVVALADVAGPGGQLMGTPPLAILALGVILGGAFGCFVGSMTGLTPSEPPFTHREHRSGSTDA
ncbi:MAG TPA: DUF6789 family protein [Chloroflexota bacterium]|nr:DUF6789 family protein [Chloroflexota bacterium]